jgi:hypothetical protein
MPCAVPASPFELVKGALELIRADGQKGHRGLKFRGR